MIQFSGSNIECFEYLSHAHRIWGNYSIINGLVFIKSFEKDYKYFL